MVFLSILSDPSAITKNISLYNENVISKKNIQQKYVGREGEKSETKNMTVPLKHTCQIKFTNKDAIKVLPFSTDKSQIRTCIWMDLSSDIHISTALVCSELFMKERRNDADTVKNFAYLHMTWQKVACKEIGQGNQIIARSKLCG